MVKLLVAYVTMICTIIGTGCFVWSVVEQRHQNKILERQQKQNQHKETQNDGL